MHRAWLLGTVIALGCGPTIDPQDETTTSDGSTSFTSGTGAMSLGTTSGPPPGTTTTEVTTAVDDTSSSTDSPFIEVPELLGCGEGGGGGGGGGSSFECDSWVQDCCPGDKCVPWANDGGVVWNSSRCSPVDPDGAAPGEPCRADGTPTSGIDDCDATSICWNVDVDTLEGYCVPQCTGTEEDPMCPDGTNCVIANDGYVHLCLNRCDPLAPSCMDGEACLPYDGDFLCITTGTTRVGLPGDPCMADYECTPDGLCAPMAEVPGCMGPGCCTPYCDHLDGSGTTLCAMLDPALVCEPLYPPGTAPEGLDHLGTCRLP